MLAKKQQIYALLLKKSSLQNLIFYFGKKFSRSWPFSQNYLFPSKKQWQSITVKKAKFIEYTSKRESLSPQKCPNDLVCESKSLKFGDFFCESFSPPSIPGYRETSNHFKTKSLLWPWISFNKTPQKSNIMQMKLGIKEICNLKRILESQ